MKKKICPHIKKFLSCTASDRPNFANSQTGVDVREEYANAFRTESYIDFWTRVLTLSCGDMAMGIPVESSTTAARLPSYRLFVEHLLEPNQLTITRTLTLSHIRPKIRFLLSYYFSETANAFLLYSKLLKDAQNIRVKYRSLKTALHPLEMTEFSHKNNTPLILTHLIEFSNTLNPFMSSPSSPYHIWTLQFNCSELLKQLESSRDRAGTKFRLMNRLKHGSAISLAALTISLTVIVASHALALLVAAPGLITASIELTSTHRLARVSAQLDAAAKGTYILNRDLDTISRLVARLNSELEHMRAMIKFWLERGDDRIQAIAEVARQLKKNESNFSQQLDELEEHLYLCFMTINRARNLVVKEILDPGQPTTCTRKLTLK